MSFRDVNDFQKAADKGGLIGIAAPYVEAPQRFAGDVIGREQPRVGMERRDPLPPDVGEIFTEGHEQRHVAALRRPAGGGPVFQRLFAQGDKRQQHLAAGKECPECQIVARGIEERQERRDLFHQRMLGEQEAVVGDDGDPFLHEPSGDLCGLPVGAHQHGDVPPRTA